MKPKLPKSLLYVCLFTAFVCVITATIAEVHSFLNKSQAPGDFEYAVFLNEYHDLYNLVENQASLADVRNYVLESQLINEYGKENEVLNVGAEGDFLLGYRVNLSRGKQSQYLKFIFGDNNLNQVILSTNDYYFATVDNVLKDFGDPDTITVRKSSRGPESRWKVYEFFLIYNEGLIIQIQQGTNRKDQSIVLSPSDSIDLLYLFHPDNAEEVIFDLLFEQKFGTTHIPNVNNDNLGSFFYDWNGFGSVDELYPNYIELFHMK
jgi:hypothetical protein